MNRRMRIALLVTPLGVLGAFGIWQFLGDKSPENRGTKSGYINGEPKSDTVIVFVHGLFGSSESWSSQSTSFPKLLSDDPDVIGPDKNRPDIYVHDYYTPVAGSGSNPSALANLLKLDLENDRVFADHRHVIFVCHSMGGLIVRTLLNRNHELVSKVPMIFFFATPTNGSDLGNLGKLFRNRAVGDLKPLEINTWLGATRDDWLAESGAGRRVASYCAYEDDSVGGVQVVTQSSATALCTNVPLAIPLDHFDIVKPSDRNATSYKALKTSYLKEQARWIQTNAKIPWADPNAPSDVFDRPTANWSIFFLPSEDQSGWRSFGERWNRVYGQNRKGFLDMDGPGCIAADSLSASFYDFRTTFQIVYGDDADVDLFLRAHTDQLCRTAARLYGAGYRFRIQKRQKSTSASLRVKAERCRGADDCQQIKGGPETLELPSCEAAEPIQFEVTARKWTFRLRPSCERASGSVGQATAGSFHYDDSDTTFNGRTIGPAFGDIGLVVARPDQRLKLTYLSIDRVPVAPTSAATPATSGRE